ncbi:MAG: lysine 5,6-aminomutase subunit alpha TIM-barrel domain-containing protein, partial [Halarsenatibacteraceae bacterium]
GRADQVLDETVEILEEIAEKGLISALESGLFAGIERPRAGGKGKDGAIEKSSDYYNPFAEIFRKELTASE